MPVEGAFRLWYDFSTTPMTRRTYDQYCPIATALDVVGERWSLLIVRELLVSPRRYSDLRAALPGMWTNLLADRLSHLERHNVIRRVQRPAPEASTVYELTDDGLALEPVVLALGGWGLPRLGRRRPGQPVPTSTAVLAGLRAWFRPELAAEADEAFGARVGELHLVLDVSRGRLQIHANGDWVHKATLVADPAALLAVRRGEVGVAEAEQSGSLRFHGPRADVARLRRLFHLAS